MLDTLPPEILEQILGNLLTASSIVNLACVNSKLYGVISKNDYGVFKEFVQRAFPSIRTPPLWRDMTFRLTTRSRAWDRRAMIARECCPPTNDSSGPDWLGFSSKFGFTPVIDSYEDFSGGRFSDRKEVLAYGAAGRLRIRRTEKNIVSWSSSYFADDHLPQHDIVDVRLLRPHQKDFSNGETMIIARASKEITKVVSHHDVPGRFTQVASYDTGLSSMHCMAINNAEEPSMIVFDNSRLQIFSLHNEGDVIQPQHTMSLLPTYPWRHRRRTAKFLTNELVMCSVQYTTGTERSPVVIYNITNSHAVGNQIQPVESLSSGEGSRAGRHAACSLASLDATASMTGRPGQCFLSGWTDGVVRMYDLRTPLAPVMMYEDPVDDGQVLSLLPIGHERFFAGSHQNACLKVFDMRMSGARCYSYLDASDRHGQVVAGKTRDLATKSAMTRIVPVTPADTDTEAKRFRGDPQLQQRQRRQLMTNARDINIFLALTINNQSGRLWQRLPQSHEIKAMNFRARNRLSRYRGSIYSLSSPSPSSSTLYAGIENHIIQLDFKNTDDMLHNPDVFCKDDPSLYEQVRFRHASDSSAQDHRRTQHGVGKSRPSHTTDGPTEMTPEILSLSSYERPRPSHEMTDAVLLRKQVDWHDMMAECDHHQQNRQDESSRFEGEMIRSAELEKGWDIRWRKERNWKDRPIDSESNDSNGGNGSNAYGSGCNSDVSAIDRNSTNTNTNTNINTRWSETRNGAGAGTSALPHRRR